MEQPSPQIYLASRSPRRSELLRQIRIRHQILDIQVDETPRPEEAPAEYVIRLALDKAAAGRELPGIRPDLPVLAADTAVVADDQILGKPEDLSHALAMLRLLSGRCHKVLTGVALACPRLESRLSVSRVCFRPITEAEAVGYWQSGEPRDKAGGYAIQGLGAMFVTRIEGSYSGVMGLPLYETTELFAAAGMGSILEESR